MMRKPRSQQTKICPLIDRECLKQGCELYSEMLNRCDISLLVYNLYRLGELEKQRLGDKDPASAI